MRTLFYSCVFLLAALSVCLDGCANAPRSGEAEASGYLFGSIEHGGRDYPYTVYVPRGLDRAHGPARGLVFLHGSGECGTDGSKPLAVGLPPAVMLEPDRWPFVVLIPQKPSSASEWEDHSEAVLAMLDQVIARHGVDPGRVAITGLSQGGHGAMTLASAHPDRFCASAPVCGYVLPRWVDGERGTPGPPATPEREAAADGIVRGLSGMPVWLFHGGRDNVVSPDESRWLHERLEAAGADSRLTVFPEANHNAWDSAYRGVDLAGWLVEMTE